MIVGRLVGTISVCVGMGYSGVAAAAQTSRIRHPTRATIKAIINAIEKATYFWIDILLAFI